MKKTLLAIAMTGLFGATAQATTVYDANGTTLDLGADIEVAYSKSMAEDSDTTMSVEDADIRATLTQAVNENLAAFGKIEIDAERDGDDIVDQLIVGLIGDMGTVSFGQQYTIADDIGIFNDYKLDIDNVVVTPISYGEQVIKYKFANDTFYVGAAYAMNQEASEGEEGDDSGFDGNLGYTGIENVDLSIWAGSNDVSDETTTYVQLQAIYSMDNLTLKAYAGYTDVEDESGNGFGASVDYVVDKATYSLGVTSVDNSDIDGADRVVYVAGLGYALTSNMTAYAQIGGNDEDDSELGYAVGIDVGF